MTDSLAALIARVGDDSPTVEKEIFQLYAAAEDVLLELDRRAHGAALPTAIDRLRAALPRRDVIATDIRSGGDPS